MSEQTLIFCVGAAKSGTSWLQAFLREHEECYFRNLKELHYFDALDAGGRDWHVKLLARRLIEMRKKLAEDPHCDSNEWLLVLISDIESWLTVFDGKNAIDDAYLDYIGYGRVQKKVVGDVTPAYGGVSREMLAHMAGLGADVKFIYVMRDPVARLWSGFRMVLDRYGEGKMQALITRFLADEEGDDHALMVASDYKGTLKKLRAVIAPENLHIEFYETMFTQNAVDRICGFIGIEPAPVPRKMVVHKGKRVALPSILRDVLAKKLKPQYSFVKEIMGGVPPEWTENMVSA
jgi:hypothetical protein